MKQVAKIKLDEEGTEASAVTVIGIDEKAALTSTKRFHATHPFLYVISEQATDGILFIGQYTGY
jgi:serpin B